MHICLKYFNILHTTICKSFFSLVITYIPPVITFIIFFNFLFFPEPQDVEKTLVRSVQKLLIQNIYHLVQTLRGPTTQPC